MNSEQHRLAQWLLSAVLIAGIVLNAAAQEPDLRTFTGKSVKSFSERLHELETTSDSSLKPPLVEILLDTVNKNRGPVIEDSTVYFMYAGDANAVTVPGDFNGWNPRADSMKRIQHTSLFYLAKQFPLAARIEYKLCVDSVWILDPLNRRQVLGGYGPNSEVWMPQYRPPAEVEPQDDVPRGIIDSLKVHSTILRRMHPVFVYLPPGYNRSSGPYYPTIYVNDGGEYITLARMPTVMDNLIAEQRIPPVVGVFVDPRTDVNDASTSTRMQDYTLSESYVRFLVEELRPLILKRYRISKRPEQTAIMGASLGGLISTFAAFKRPDVFGLSAAQSPSYWWANDTLISVVAKAPRRNVKFYIDTGTLHDAREKAFEMKTVLAEKGYTVQYEEHPEGHNWANWRARISRILEYFFGKTGR